MKTVSILGLLAIGVISPSVWAAPTATLVFKTPSGTVGSSDSIPVYVTLTLDSASTPIETDASGEVTSGFDASDLPAGFNVSSSNTNFSFECSGTFTNGCDGPPYDFDFALGQDSFFLRSDLNLQPGSSTDFLFGTFTPTNGTPVAAGTYNFYDAGFFFQLYDNTQPDPITAEPWHVDVQIASTCPGQQASCSFQRTVVAVPEPETYVMLLAGLGLVGFVVRKNKQVPARN